MQQLKAMQNINIKTNKFNKYSELIDGFLIPKQLKITAILKQYKKTSKIA
jgi:hypothetical protein